MMVRTPIGFITSSLAVALLLMQGGCTSKPYENIGEKPVRTAAPAPEINETSSIALNVFIPYTTLSNGLTTALPASIPVNKRQNVCKEVEVGGFVGDLFGKPKLGKHCTDVDYEATVTREGAVVASPLPDAVRLAVPLKVDGHAGLNGFIADMLKLNKKNFRGAMLINADLKVDVDEAWCPKISVAPTYKWTDKAKFEIAERVWLNVDSEVDASLKPEMEKASARIAEFVTCDQVKQLVLPVWREHVISLPPISGQTGNIVVTPESAGFSGFSYQPDGVQLALLVGARAQVIFGTGAASASTPGSTPAPAAPSSSAPATAAALPKLQRIPPTENKLKLAVPLTASYDSLKSLAGTAVIDKPFEGSAGDTHASVTIKELEVYPSGDRLVLGARFESKISKPQSLAPQGWVYFVAKPHFDAASQTLSLTDISFSRIIDNDLWNALSFLFQGQIRAAIEKAARFDLKPHITEARAVLRKELATPKQGLKIDMKDESIGLRRVTITEGGVQVVVLVEGTANISVLGIPSK